jgi:hypothetical protein
MRHLSRKVADDGAEREVDVTFKDGAYYPFGCTEEMSEGAYQAVHDELVAELRSPPASLSEAIGYWRTRDRRVLKITEMSTAHLRNAIQFFVAWSDHSKILELRTELAGRST